MKTKTLQTLAVMGIASAALASSAMAASFTIYSTGFTTGSTSVQAAARTPDGNYSVIESGGVTLVTPVSAYVDQTVSQYAANNSSSKWDSTQAGDSFSAQPVGVYGYQTTFSLTSFEAATAVITGLWGGDNAYDGIYLNGNLISGTIGPQLSTTNEFSTLSNAPYSPFTISSGFQSGTNTLDFFIDNTGASASPTAFRAQLSGSYAVPEPSTVAVYAIGSLAVLGFVVRKKRIS